jgi:nicotinic acid mononucleotide adenylyltransferase
MEKAIASMRSIFIAYDDGMEFHRRAVAAGGAAALFPGAFHPPTRAHLAMAEAALAFADEVVLLLPREFPHKRYEGPGAGERLGLLRLAAEAAGPRFSVAVSEGGLFIEIAREYRCLHPGARVLLVCGRDAAERSAGWDYGAAAPFERQLEEYELLVAPRGGVFAPPPALAGRVHPLPLEEDWQEVSSTTVRERLRCGLPWRHLVPATLHEAVARLYS